MVPEERDLNPGTWRGGVIPGLAAGLTAAIMVLTFWTVALPERPLLPTSDLYTHLSVSRNLIRGEGFKTDIAYPLSFAYPFARELPQPLIHRQPGFALLLVPVVQAVGVDPERSPRAVMVFQTGIAALIVFAGTALLRRRKQLARAIPWVLLLATNPLFGFALQWGMVEIVCSGLLFWIWIRATSGTRPGPADGLLAGSLVLMRGDLFWVPVLWWLWQIISTRKDFKASRSFRGLAAALLVWLVVTAPWLIRNTRLTGSPVFTLQAQAEMVKDTSAWPGYSVYRGLEPQPMVQGFIENTGPVLRKTARGLRFYWKDRNQFLPAPLSLGILLATLWVVVGRIRSLAGGGKTASGSEARDLGMAGGTLFLLSVQYSFFDHSLRHLVVLLPVLTWELAPWLGEKIVAPRSSGSSRPWLIPTLTGTVVAVLLTLLFPCRLPGWEHAASEAKALQAQTEAKVAQAKSAPPGLIFVDDGAVPWFADRPGVWWPLEEDVIQQIQTYFSTDERPVAP